MLRLDAVPTDPTYLRRAYGCFPSGVTAVCATIGDEPVGMAASSFTSVSIDPPLVSLCVQLGSETWPRLRGCGRLGISVLANGQDAACRSLANKHGDRFRGVDWQSTSDGAVLIRGAALRLDCSVHDEISAGDHLIVVLFIHGLKIDEGTEPLVFHGSRFRQLAAI